MPASYVIDVAERVVRMRAWGIFCNADLRDYYHALRADGRFQSDFQCLVNFEAVQRFALDSPVIAEVASWTVFDVGVRRAIIAPTDVAFGLSRMFSVHAQDTGQNVAVFRTQMAAEVWLSSPPDALRGQPLPPRRDGYMRVA